MISTVIYFIGKVLTFPGAYIKAFFEHLIARAFSIPVEDTKYLRFTDAAAMSSMTRSEARRRFSSIASCPVCSPR